MGKMLGSRINTGLMAFGLKRTYVRHFSPNLAQMNTEICLENTEFSPKIEKKWAKPKMPETR